MSTNLIELRDTAAQIGDNIYNQKLRALEGEQSGRLVAIYIPTGEYFVGSSILEAAGKLREKHPNAGAGDVYTRRIGDRAAVYAKTPRVTGKF